MLVVNAFLKQTVGAIAALVVLSTGAGANLITNGGFEAGNTGFSSGYSHVPGNIGGAGTYDTIANPASAHSLATSYGDHTTGSELMMAINDSTTPGDLVWGQTISITAATE